MRSHATIHRLAPILMLFLSIGSYDMLGGAAGPCRAQ